MNIKRVIINKNRGWRGLAEIKCENDKREVVYTSIFSFSPLVWKDLINNLVVTIKVEDKFIILHLDSKEGLPKPSQQRSVLIKNYIGTITEITEIAEDDVKNAQLMDRVHIRYYVDNKNNHTTSTYNYIGIRVNPDI